MKATQVEEPRWRKALTGLFQFKRLVSKTVAPVVAAAMLAPVSLAASTLPSAEKLVGALQQYQVGRNDSLIEIARRFDLGFNEIVAANPGVDPFIPKTGSPLIIPTAWIVPAVPRRPVIVVNLPEFRLYYFPKKGSRMMTYPLGIGDEGRATPVGSYRIVEKIVNPSWYVPDSIRRQQWGLPKVVPPGPNNPMGSHALRLSLESILIHGTNRPWGIGRRSSHGCLRLYPEDIVPFFKAVPKGMRVVIINQPIKVAAERNRVFVECHLDRSSDAAVGLAMQLLADRKLLVRVDFSKLRTAVLENRGVPVDVTLVFAEPRPAAKEEPGKKQVMNRGLPGSSSTAGRAVPAW